MEYKKTQVNEWAKSPGETKKFLVMADGAIRDVDGYITCPVLSVFSTEEEAWAAAKKEMQETLDIDKTYTGTNPFGFTSSQYLVLSYVGKVEFDDVGSLKITKVTP